MLVERYVDQDGNRNHIVANITKARNGKYYIMYDPIICPYNGGCFDTLKAAEKIIEESRPTARKINNICINCKTDCIGTCEQVWTGCIYRK